MNSTSTVILNFEEIRRRSIILWSGIPADKLMWKPDESAMTCIEMVRHLLEGEHLFHKIVENRGNLGDFPSPFAPRPYVSVDDEIEFAKPYRESFLNYLKTFSESDLGEIEIVRSEVGQRRKLGDYLQRIAYHEAVHTGQMLDYLRTMNVPRPKIWD